MQPSSVSTGSAAEDSKTAAAATKYYEESQKDCARVETEMRWAEVDWHTFTAAADQVLQNATKEDSARELVRQVFVKAGLGAAYDDPASHIQGLVEMILQGTENIEELKLVFPHMGLFYCKGDATEKAEAFFARIPKDQKCEEPKTFHGTAILQPLLIPLATATGIVPVLAGEKAGQYADEYKIKDGHISTWWHGPLETDCIPKDLLISWFQAGNYTPAAARDAARKMPLPRIAPSNDSDVAKALPGGITKKEYTRESQKACLAWEKELAMPDWTNLALSGEYCKRGHKPYMVTPEYLQVIVTKAGFREGYEKNAERFKQIFASFFEYGPDTFIAQWTYFCAFMCPGKESDKATEMWKIMNKWDVTQKTTAAENIAAMLERCMRLAAETVPKSANVAKEFEGVDASVAAAVWWGIPVSDKVSRDDFYRWVCEGRFSPAEAREAALKG